MVAGVQNHLLNFSPMTGLLERVAIQKRIEVIDQYGARMLPQFWMQMRLGLPAQTNEFSGPEVDRGFEVAFDLPYNMAVKPFSGYGQTIKLSSDGEMVRHPSLVLDEEDGLIFSHPEPERLSFPYAEREKVTTILMGMFEFDNEIIHPEDGANVLGVSALRNVFSHLGFYGSDLVREVSKYRFCSYI